MRRVILLLVLLFSLFVDSTAQQSVARRWNEVLIKAIREDLARPPVQARNLYHTSLAMYEAWVVYEDYAKTYLLDKTVNNIYYPFNGIPAVSPANKLAAQNKAISYAAYRFLYNRFQNSPSVLSSRYRFDTLMLNLGYDTSIKATTYSSGNPAHMGNYIAAKVIQFGFADSCHQNLNYAYVNYTPVNPPLKPSLPGDSSMVDPNRWQPLFINIALDQSGNPVPSLQKFIGPEWGRGFAFAMPPGSCVNYYRNGAVYPVYHDPGEPPKLNLTDVTDTMSQFYKWGHSMTAIWSSFLDANDTSMIDISPNAIGNISYMPSSFSGQQTYYNYLTGADTGKGYTLNPITNMPYTPNIVKRGDYSRVVSQYWADGPASETPPGHWFVLLNQVGDNPSFVKKYEGTGPILSNLEWDIKTYLTLGGAMHDAAIACWGVKGWYDSPRPISAIRKMAEYGQSTDSLLPHYHPGGLPLVPGYIELVTATDSLGMADTNNINKIKLKAWRGFTDTTNPLAGIQAPTGVGWILAERWLPYQRKTFVTPPFAGYVSGHSTYSRAGAEVLTALTGSEFFPGGLGQTTINPAQNFLQFETGPSAPITLQWASYRDASNQASISRIMGGIHPPFDDIRGRIIGQQVGIDAHTTAKAIFNQQFALPVHIVYFSATENNCNVHLAWATVMEHNTNSYEIWRSEDGVHFDTKIGEVPAVTQVAEENTYAYVDTKPLQQNYYKLKIVDNDFATTESESSYINMKNCIGTGVTFASIYPNPIINDLHVKINTAQENETAWVTIADVTGRKVLEKNITLASIENDITIPMSTIANGHYIIQVTVSNGYNATYKFVKK